MNKNIMIASAIAAGATALFYFIKRKRKIDNSIQQVPVRESRHLTNVFAKAKHQL